MKVTTENNDRCLSKPCLFEKKKREGAVRRKECVTLQKGEKNSPKTTERIGNKVAKNKNKKDEIAKHGICNLQMGKKRKVPPTHTVKQPT